MEMDTGMNIYQWDKNAAASMPAMSYTQMLDKKPIIVKFLKQFDNIKHIMLLSNELRYYTIFDITAEPIIDNVVLKLLKFLKNDTFLKTLGKTKYIDIDETESHIEIWIGEERFALFPCDSFVVPIEEV